MARNKRPTANDIRQQQEQLKRLAIEDVDARFMNYLLNRPTDNPHPRDGPKKK